MTQIYITLWKKKTPKKSKRTRKIQVITPDVCKIAVKNDNSNRSVMEMIGASTSHINPKDKNLSVNAVQHKKNGIYNESFRKDILQ